MIYKKMAHPCTHYVANQANKSKCLRAKGRSIYWITRVLYLTYNCVPQYIWGYFAEMCNKSHWILQRIYQLTFALSRRCLVSRSRLRVFRETRTVLSLWRHSSGSWDNAASIAAHSNALSRTMSVMFKCLGSITIQGKQGSRDTI